MTNIEEMKSDAKYGNSTLFNSIKHLTQTHKGLNCELTHNGKRLMNLFEEIIVTGGIYNNKPVEKEL